MAWANTLDTNTPDGASQKVPVIDDVMKTDKKAWQERLNTCLYFPLTGTQISDLDAGKIRKLHFKEAVTTKPPLVAGEGAVYMKLVGSVVELFWEQADGTEKQITTGGKLNLASAELLGILANNTYFTAKNAAGTGTVNLIKSDGSDGCVLPNTAQLSGSLAPVVDAGIANKKYVDDTPHTGGIVQIVNSQTGAVATGTTAIPADDTIPQITEGDQYMSLAITPKSATNKLKIDVIVNINSNSNYRNCAALFQDTNANALACQFEQNPYYGTTVAFTHYMVAGTTSQTTFKVRCGANGGTLTFNGIAGVRVCGGVLASSITITEIKV